MFYLKVMVEDKPSVNHFRIVIARMIGGINPKVMHTEINEYETSGLPAIEEMTNGPVCELMVCVKNLANRNSL